MCTQLEKEVENVEDKEDNGSSMGEDRNVLVDIFFRIGRGSIQLMRVSIRAYPGRTHHTAGIIKDAAATVSSEDMVDATVELKACSIPCAVPVLVL